jgi:hypothetical protein
MLSGAIRHSSLQLLHEKVLKLSHSAYNEEAGVGKIVNMATTDLDMFEFISLLNALWFSPLFLVVVSVTMYLVVGLSGLIGLSIIVLLIPL